ncbi:hypothetical protein RvY_07554-2 [Ramazzottius varieornatus]|uniref:CAP-Gly domain-containing protein n=1 Tax=Ramazzottius varieornatus TaxID=947166 RepID=A0A1D1V2L5_RAMVA|nr:hypothetical protein RvY_07554-2 [Ramazzottius varieornatus]
MTSIWLSLTGSRLVMFCEFILTTTSSKLVLFDVRVRVPAREREVRGLSLWIGIELVGSFTGKSNSDGVHRGKRYFTSHQKSALFISIDEIDYMKLVRSATEIQPPDSLVQLIRIEPRLKGSLVGSVPNQVTIEELEDFFCIVLPYPITFTVEFFCKSREGIEIYGRKKHQQNVERLKKLPGVGQVVEYEDCYHVVMMAPEIYPVVRESLRLREEMFKLDQQARPHFSSKPGIETRGSVGGISGCDMAEEQAGSTANAAVCEKAKALLDDETSSVDPSEKVSKKKPKKKKRPGNPFSEQIVFEV